MENKKKQKLKRYSKKINREKNKSNTTKTEKWD